MKDKINWSDFILGVNSGMILLIAIKTALDFIL